MYEGTSTLSGHAVNIFRCNSCERQYAEVVGDVLEYDEGVVVEAEVYTEAEPTSHRELADDGTEYCICRNCGRPITPSDGGWHHSDMQARCRYSCNCNFAPVGIGCPVHPEESSS